MPKIYEVLGGDIIIGMLDLPTPCPVKVTIQEKYVVLQIGPRDWEWDKETGEFLGAGTSLKRWIESGEK